MQFVGSPTICALDAKLCALKPVLVRPYGHFSKKFSLCLVYFYELIQCFKSKSWSIHFSYILYFMHFE